MKVLDYSIVVPVYKTTTSLTHLSQQVQSLFGSDLSDKTFELIFVNDSPFSESTCQTLVEIASQSPQVKVINLTKNFGQQAAVLCGIAYSKGQYIITMDDDMQHDPLDIPKLIEKQSHDIVIASFRNKKHSLFKRVTSLIKGYFDCLILKKPKDVKLTSFRLFNRTVADNMLEIKTPYPFIPALLFLVSNDVVNVQLPHYPRYEGESNYTLRKMLGLFSNLLINNSSVLLKYIGFLGLFISFASFIYAGLIVYQKIFLDIAFQGWSSIMVSILFFGGVIMFTLGVIGEYLIRIIHTSERRPNYFVRDVNGE